MPFSLSQFAKTRPYLYHLTSQRNCKRLVRGRTLHSAAKVLRASNSRKWLDKKRTDIVTVTFEGQQLDLRDQYPLYKGKTRLEGGWTFEDLIKELNQRVFFWPGWQDEVISYGVRHFERYAVDSPALMRVKTQDLFDVNPRMTPHFCKYNSGSPRTTKGRGSPRGPNTFIECSVAPFAPSNVVEVTYLGSIKLPNWIEVSAHPSGPWRRR